MTQTLHAAEKMVNQLIADANATRFETYWRYELTSEVDNIEVARADGVNTLRIHPCWLRYVVTLGEFKSCVADEIAAWHLLDQLTGTAA